MLTRGGMPARGGQLFHFGFVPVPKPAPDGVGFIAAPVPAASGEARASGIQCPTPGCTKVFTNEGNLANHMRAAHGHLGANQSSMHTAFAAAGAKLTTDEQSARHKLRLEAERAKMTAKAAELLQKREREVWHPARPGSAEKARVVLF
jgi:hypothetical protein